jgi:uncharacterized membrane protein YraQ (UPF0718 family)
MILTGVVAVNLAVVAASNHVPDLILAVYISGPILVVVQLALYRSVFGRRQRRGFWLGFAAAGPLAAAVVLKAFWHFPTQEVLIGAYGTFWDGIDRIAPGLNRVVSSHQWSIDAAFSMYYFVPQVLVALLGGVLTDRLTKFVQRSTPPRNALNTPGVAADRICSIANLP